MKDPSHDHTEAMRSDWQTCTSCGVTEPWMLPIRSGAESINLCRACTYRFAQLAIKTPQGEREQKEKP